MHNISPLQDLIMAIGRKGFAETLAGLCRIVSHDAAALLLFRDPRPPVVLVDHLRPDERDTMYDEYLAGVYLLSPFHRAARELSSARAARVRDIAPEGFRSSEYYRRYFGRIGVADMLGLLVPCGDGTVLFQSLSRSGGSFTRADLRSFEAILPAVEAAVRRHVELAGPLAPRTRENRTRQTAASPLTAREQQVVTLILEGHASRSLAATLGISIETVRVHRRHIYEKLNVSSQAELFRWFLTARQT